MNLCKFCYPIHSIKPPPDLMVVAQPFNSIGIFLVRPIIRHAISRIIAVIAELELGASHWPELLPWLQQATSSSSVRHREIGIFALFTSLETIIDANPTSPMSFIQHFTTLLEDPESLEVRITTLRSVSRRQLCCCMTADGFHCQGNGYTFSVP